MHTKTTTILALAASLALAATDEEQPARRRLRDTVDLTRVHEKAEAEALTGALSFKLDAAAAAKKGGADALAHRVADLIAAGKSILFLGAPGAGKSTALRDAASFNPAPYIT